MAGVHDFFVIIRGLLVVGFFTVLEHTIWRRNYIGYYDWPSRSLEEYSAECDRLAAQHKANWNE